MQGAFHRQVHRVAGAAGDDRRAERVSEACAAGFAGDVRLGRRDAMNGVPDRPIAGAATQIAFERARQVCLLLVVERGDGHDHAGGAEAALKSLGVEKGLLDRMQLAAGREPLDGRHLAIGGAKGRHEAGVHRFAVEPDRAGAAIAGVAALLDAEEAELAQEGAQALTGLRLGGKPLSIDGVFHVAPADAASSARICSAK